ncbi:MAG: 5-formyltetrahydrofolate cyclo-ligase [Eubacteriales bacterium]
MNKNDLRKQILNVRAQMPKRERVEKSKQIEKIIYSLNEYTKAKVVMVYLSIRDEVETTGIACNILENNKRLVIPRCVEKNNLQSYFINNLDKDIEQGTWGIREPCIERVQVAQPEEIDLVLVPGVVFDRAGGRIGFGRGYYDRFLPHMRENAVIIGLAFESQVVKNVEMEKHDCKMSLLITENGVIYAG